MQPVEALTASGEVARSPLPVRYVRIIAFCVLAFTGLSFGGRLLWWADLMAHLRLHYAVVLMGLAAVFFALRHSTLFLLCVVGSLLNFYAVAMASSVYTRLSSHETSVISGQHIIVATYNVHAVTSSKALTDWLVDLKPDVAVLVEANQDWQPALDKLAAIFPYQSVTHSSSVYGMAFLSRFPLSSPTMNVSGPLHLPVLSADIETPVGKICVIGVHPNPPFGSLEVLARNLYINQAGAMARTRGLPCVIAGDFNSTAWSSGFESLRNLPNLQPESWRTPATWPSILGPWGLPLSHILLTIPVDKPEPLKIVDLWAGPLMFGSSYRPLVARIEAQ